MEKPQPKTYYSEQVDRNALDDIKRIFKEDLGFDVSDSMMIRTAIVFYREHLEDRRRKAESEQES